MLWDGQGGFRAPPKSACDIRATEPLPLVIRGRAALMRPAKLACAQPKTGMADGSATPDCNHI